MSSFVEQRDWGLVIDWLFGHGIRILIILALALILYVMLRRAVHPLVKGVIERGQKDLAAEEQAKRAETLSHVIVRTGLVVIFIASSFMLLSELGIDIAPVLASVGIAGIAIGFGSQSLVKDVLAGLFVILEDQYRVGDVVKIADVSGVVETFNLRRTVLRDLDGTVHTVPNGQIRVASNLTRGWSRINMDVTVSYEEDIDRVINVLNRVGKELTEDANIGPLIVEPPQVLRVENFLDSGIAIKILGTTKPIKQWDVMGELRRRIKKAFDEEGIEIPVSHRVIITKPAEEPHRQGKSSPD